jgi:hypothetical protein
VHSKIPQEPFNGILLQVAVPTMHLECIVDYVEALVSCLFFCHSAVHCGVWLFFSQETSGMSNHQA